MMRIMERRVVAGVVLLAALATAVTLLVKHDEAGEIEASGDSFGAQTSERRTRPLVTPLVPEQQRSLAAVEDPPDAALLAQIEHKYRLLIADVEAEHRDELRRRLLERESQLDASSRARIDVRIGKLLPAESFAYYQTLKDLGQRHVAEDTSGISHVAPRDERQEQRIDSK